MSSSWVLTIAVALVSLGVAASKDCPRSVSHPPGTVRSQTGSDGRNCYAFINTPESYAAAETICEDHRGFLVNILNDEENTFVANLMMKDKKDYVEGWLGLDDSAPGGGLKWNGNSPPSFMNFASDDESDVTSGEVCVAMYTGGDRKWRKYNCGTRFHKPFVCQFPL